MKAAGRAGKGRKAERERVRHVRRGDTVVVIAGNDRGKSGEVKQVDYRTGRVLVDGVNQRWTHKRPTQQTPKGERVQEERPIHASNVMRLDPDSGKPTRARRRPEA